MEGVHVYDKYTSIDEVSYSLELNVKGLINSLFPNTDYRMRRYSFPFTNPSWEVDVFYKGKWLEVLGCGIIHSGIMSNCGLHNHK